MVRRLNIDGDGQGDRSGHGGEQRAVFVYQIESYRYWEEQLGRDGFTYGQFGENFTVEGLPDDEVCIGDRYRIGDAVFEVTQPRVTCYRVGIRMDEPQMPSLLVSHRRPGFYLRVLQEGEVQAGDEITKLTTGPEAMTVAEMDGLLYLPRHPRHEPGSCPAHPGTQPGVARVVPDPARSGTGLGEPGPQPGGGSASGLERVPALPGGRHRPGERERDLDTPRAPGAAGPEPRAARPVRDRSGPARRRGRPAAPQLLALGTSRAATATGSASSERRTVRPAPICTAGSGSVTPSSSRRRAGAFVLQPGDRPVVLVSAGVGATPVLAMLHALAEDRSRRQVWWLHGARSRAEHSFAREVDDLLAVLPDAHRLVCYSNPGPDDRAGLDFDVQGRLTAQVLDDAATPIDGSFYLCGPSPFMDEVGAALAARGVTPDRINVEVFGPSDPITPGIVGSTTQPPHPPEGPPGPGPEISFSRSNLTVAWDPAFPSLLELAEACDVPVRWSCRSGVCHTCETGLVSGTVSYLPDPVEDAGPGNAYLCCSQPQSDLVLDL